VDPLPISVAFVVSGFVFVRVIFVDRSSSLKPTSDPRNDTNRHEMSSKQIINEDNEN